MTTNNLKLNIWETEFNIKFPITKEFIAINNLKAKLSEDKYDTLPTMGTEGIVSSMMVDTIAHFAVMLPTLKDKLNVNGLMELPTDKLFELCWVYADTYKPWFDDILNTISLKKSEAKEEVAEGIKVVA